MFLEIIYSLVTSAKREAILFLLDCSEVNSTWLITSELANQRMQKTLFTCVVYTNLSYYNYYNSSAPFVFSVHVVFLFFFYLNLNAIPICSGKFSHIIQVEQIQINNHKVVRVMQTKNFKCNVFVVVAIVVS